MSQSLVSVLPPLILSCAAFLFPLAWHAAQLFLVKQLNKLPANLRPLVADMVSSAVHYVEQVHPELAGADKKVQALSVIQSLLSSHKLSVSSQELDVLLEEAVFLMNQSKPAPLAPLGFSPAAASPSAK